jgi:hypothetical protein
MISRANEERLRMTKALPWRWRVRLMANELLTCYCAGVRERKLLFNAVGIGAAAEIKFTSYRR